MESLTKHSAQTQRNLRYLVACLLAGLTATSMLACSSDDSDDADKKESSTADSKSSEDKDKDSTDKGSAGSESKDDVEPAGEFIPPAPSAEQEKGSQDLMRFDGTWKGTTSQDKPIEFKILTRFLGHIEVTYKLEGDGCKAEDKTAKASAMVGLRMSAFTIMNKTETETLMATAKFTADAESNGTFTVTPATVPEGCNASVTGTWNATK